MNRTRRTRPSVYRVVGIPSQVATGRGWEYLWDSMKSATTVDANMTMRELLEQYPGAQRALFRKYHIGGCSSCGFKPEETLGQVCARNENLPVDQVIDYLQAAQ